ncbi:radical SAM protein [bacterium]|nr:radical SAM protein [bacterium]
MTSEYLSCDIIEYGFDAQYDAINLCCRISGNNCNEPFHIIPNYKGEKINWNDFFQKKQEIRNIHQNGEIFKPCNGCLYLRKEAWDNSNYIRTVNINNWIKCNADCIYCNRSSLKKHKEYKILPIFKDIIKHDFLKAGGPITISGGEPSIIREFKPLLELFLKNNLNNIKVLTNAIKYDKTIEKGLKKGNVNILVSTDSGTRETFTKIKRTDKHNQVWKNIKKYAQYAKYSELVKTKFIIIPAINDNKEEILEFIKQNLNSGIKYAEIDIEISWFYTHKQNRTHFDEIYELYQYAVEKAQEVGIFLEAKDRMVLFLQNIENS